MAFKPRKPTCGWGGGCKEPHTEDSYMCADHSRRLAGVREAMRREEDPYGTRGTRKRQAPQCTRPGCRNPRRPGASMCADCQEEAFWEEGGAEAD
jgi:hypothetical protein